MEQYSQIQLLQLYVAELMIPSCFVQMCNYCILSCGTSELLAGSADEALVITPPRCMNGPKLKWQLCNVTVHLLCIKSYYC